MNVGTLFLLLIMALVAVALLAALVMLIVWLARKTSTPSQVVQGAGTPPQVQAAKADGRECAS